MSMSMKKQSKSFEIWKWLIALTALLAAIFLVITASYGHPNTRVNTDSMQINALMTDSLRHDGTVLPSNVSSLHCWFTGARNKNNHAVAECEATLSGRAIDDMGNRIVQWVDLVYANPNEPEHPTHGFVRDTKSMVQTKFNFVIQRGSNGLDVRSNVDPHKLTYIEATGIVKAVADVFHKDMQKRLNLAQTTAADSVRATWQDLDRN